jgi:HEPN domain-containing protein
MSDLEHARLMLTMARKDLKAMGGMENDEATFSDEVFGFHAQQAVEKALKSWLSLIGVAYPKIHDLEELFMLLKSHLADVPDHFFALGDLTDFATHFRYEPFEDLNGGLDRAKVTRLITGLVGHVEGLVQDAGSV